jgi:phage host-nuclease inhibitor protein Gam
MDEKTISDLSQTVELLLKEKETVSAKVRDLNSTADEQKRLESESTQLGEKIAALGEIINDQVQAGLAQETTSDAIAPNVGVLIKEINSICSGTHSFESDSDRISKLTGLADNLVQVLRT